MPEQMTARQPREFPDKERPVVSRDVELTERERAMRDRCKEGIEKIGELFMKHRTAIKTVAAHEDAARKVVDIVDPIMMPPDVVEACWTVIRYCRQRVSEDNKDAIEIEAEGASLQERGP